MKKSSLFLATLLACGLCVPFAACDEGHTHTYDKTVATSDFLKSEATCTSKALYYKSCECGAKSTETFEYGEKTAHTYVNGVCACGDEETTTPPASLTQAELVDVYAAAADSAYAKTGITDPNAPTPVSLVVPDETHIATTPYEIKQVKINVAGMPAFLQLISELYDNDNFVVSDSVVSFSATVNLPTGPNETQPFALSLSLWTKADVAAEKIYLECAVVQNGMMQYNYCDIDFDFETGEVEAFRYLAHMGDIGGVYADVKLDAQDNLYINDFTSPSADLVTAMDSLKADYLARKEQGQTLTADFSVEMQKYMDTTMAISQSLQM